MLHRFRLRFADPEAEAAFREQFCLVHRERAVAALLVGGFLVVAFSLWDRVIDPERWIAGLKIRALILLPIACVTALLVLVRWVDRWFEAALMLVPAVGAIGIAVVFTRLERGFDYGAVGYVLITLFTFVLLPVRLGYFVAYCVVSAVAVLSIEALYGDSRNEMLLANGLCILTAMVLGLMSSVARERSARLQFVTERGLEESRKRIEELLHTILPPRIATRMRSGEATIAEAHGEVSIVFADLVGFTRLAQRIGAYHLVEILKTLFNDFDSHAEACGMEKIKTIGDGYMAVGGLDGETKDHVQKAARFAFAIRDTVRRTARNLDYPLDIRIGLHIGAIFAGVIGTKRPAFDCWGEAVNLASRLEENAKSGEILISEAACWQLRNLYHVTATEVDLKDVGLITVFTLAELPPDPKPRIVAVVR